MVEPTAFLSNDDNSSSITTAIDSQNSFVNQQFEEYHQHDDKTSMTQVFASEINNSHEEDNNYHLKQGKKTEILNMHDSNY